VAEQRVEESQEPLVIELPFTGGIDRRLEGPFINGFIFPREVAQRLGRGIREVALLDHLER
jgi:hypothetical protein